MGAVRAKGVGRRGWSEKGKEPGGTRGCGGISGVGGGRDGAADGGDGTVVDQALVVEKAVDGGRG